MKHMITPTLYCILLVAIAMTLGCHSKNESAKVPKIKKDLEDPSKDVLEKLKPFQAYRVRHWTLQLGDLRYKLSNYSHCEQVSCIDYTYFTDLQGLAHVHKRTILADKNLTTRYDTNVSNTEFEQVVAKTAVATKNSNTSKIPSNLLANIDNRTKSENITDNNNANNNANYNNHSNNGNKIEGLIVKDFNPHNSLDWSELKRLLLLEHYHQVARCRTSRYWERAINLHPFNRGNVVLRRADAFALDAILGLATGLEIDLETGRIAHIISLENSTKIPKNGNFYIYGPTEEDVIEGLSPFGLLGPERFSQYCDNIYDLLLNAPVHSSQAYRIYTPGYNDKNDQLASTRVDAFLRGFDSTPESHSWSLETFDKFLKNKIATIPFLPVNDQLMERINEM